MQLNFLTSFSLRKEFQITNGITILTEGSADIGFGHVRRSITLARLLEKHARVKLWLLSKTDVQTEDYIKHFEGLDWQVSPTPPETTGVEILDLEEPAMSKVLNLSSLNNRRIALDWFDSSILPEVTINLFDHSGQMQAAYAEAGRSANYIEGPQCAIIRPKLRALRPDFPIASAKVRRIIITLGGADPKRRSIEALNLLRLLDLKETQILLIVGPLVPPAYEAEIREAAWASVRVLRDPLDYDTLLADADIVICSGGGTLLESLCLGKPIVVLPQTDAEERHALSHKKLGACAMADSLASVVASFELRNSLIAKAYPQVDGRGAERIAEAALTLLRHTDSHS